MYVLCCGGMHLRVTQNATYGAETFSGQDVRREKFILTFHYQEKKLLDFIARFRKVFIFARYEVLLFVVHVR